MIRVRMLPLDGYRRFGLPQSVCNLLRVSGHDGRLVRLGERNPDVPERLRVIVHAANAGPLPMWLGSLQAPVGPLYKS